MDLPGGFKIGTLSRRTGLSTATLRLWEEHYGLLTPTRTPGRQRIYTEGDVERVLYVRHLISNRGYSLQGVASILDEARHNLPPLAQGLLDVDEAGPQSQRLGQLANDLRATWRTPSFDWSRIRTRSARGRSSQRSTPSCVVSPGHRHSPRRQRR